MTHKKEHKSSLINSKQNAVKSNSITVEEFSTKFQLESSNSQSSLVKELSSPEEQDPNSSPAEELSSPVEHLSDPVYDFSTHVENLSSPETDMPTHSVGRATMTTPS